MPGRKTGAGGPGAASATLSSGVVVSRRGFLIRSAGATALLALGGCFGEQEAAYRALIPPGQEPEVLPVREYVVLEAFANRLVPGDGDRPGARELAVAARIDRELGFHTERLQADVRDALRLVEWWPLGTHLRRFTRLAGEEQDAVIAGMGWSRLAWRRSAFQGLKMFVMFFHYTCEETWPGIGYGGPWVPRGPAV